MRKLLLIILAGSLIILIFVPTIWNWVSSFSSGLKEQEYSQLLVKSVNGEYTISIDGRVLDKVQDQSSKLFSKIETGERVIKIERTSKQSNLYFVLERKINFLPSTQVEIEWEAGPTLESSEGIIKYFTNSSNPRGTDVNVITFPANADVFLNGNPIDNNFEIINSQTNKLKISSGENYNLRDVEVRLRDDATGNPPTNIQLNIEVYLYKKPF